MNEIVKSIQEAKTEEEIKFILAGAMVASKLNEEKFNEANEFCVEYTKKLEKAKEREERRKREKPCVPAYLLYWEESERGWGTRPDGVTIALTKEDIASAIKRHWDNEKKHNPSGETPDEYTRPCGDPKLTVISPVLKEEIEETKFKSLRLWNNEYYKYKKNGEIIDE